MFLYWKNEIEEVYASNHPPPKYGLTYLSVTNGPQFIVIIMNIMIMMIMIG